VATDPRGLEPATTDSAVEGVNVPDVDTRAGGGRPARPPRTELQAEGDRLADAQTVVERLDGLKAEVDALQVHAMRSQRPWYREVAAIVAILALVFSFGTTVVSYNRTAQQDIHDQQVELRTLIERLSAIPRELIESQRTYANDPGTASTLNSILTQEQLLVAKQAARIIQSIPNEVGATEYLVVGNILVSNSLDDPGLNLLETAITKAQNANDLVSALQSRAYRLFQLGRVDEGRQNYSQALFVFRQDRYKNQSASYINYVNLQTQVNWAIAELGIRACDEARVHVVAAKELASTVPATDSKVQQLRQLEPLVAACQPPPSPSPGLIP
jgi:hypothetical protein